MDSSRSCFYLKGRCLGRYVVIPRGLVTSNKDSVMEPEKTGRNGYGKWKARKDPISGELSYCTSYKESR